MPPIIGTDDDKDPNAPEAGGGAFVEGGGGGPSTKGAPSSSGNFSNLLGYLGANQGSAKTTAAGVAGHVGGDADASTSANTDFGTKGANQIGGSFSELPGVDIAATGKAKTHRPTGPSSGGAGHGGADTPVTSGYIPGYKDSNVYGVDPNAINSINSGGKAPTVTYKGPASTAALSGDAGAAAYKAAGAASTARDDATAADGSMKGTASLLRNTYQQPSYTAGENTLDAFLTGSGDNGASIKKAGERAAGAARDYEGVTNILEHQIGKNQSDVAKTNKAYGKATKEHEATVAAAAKAKAAEEARAKVEAEAKAKADRGAAARAAAAKAASLEPAQPQWNDPVDPSKNPRVTPGAVPDINTNGWTPTPIDDPYDPNAPFLTMAHGGEVPEYGKLLQYLGGKDG